MRFKPKYSLRTLLITTAAVGLWLGWTAHVVQARKDCRQRIEQAWGTFTEDQESQVLWVRQMLGDRAIAMIIMGSRNFNGDMEAWNREIEETKRIFPEAQFVGLW